MSSKSSGIEMERMVLYPGCLVLSRFPEYEVASRRILKKLGIEVLDMEEFCCCGSSLVLGVRDDWINLPAYSLARAERLGMDIFGFMMRRRRAEEVPDLIRMGIEGIFSNGLWFGDIQFNEVRESYGLSAVRLLGWEKVAILMDEEGGS